MQRKDSKKWPDTPRPSNRTNPRDSESNQQSRPQTRFPQNRPTFGSSQMSNTLRPLNYRDKLRQQSQIVRRRSVRERGAPSWKSYKSNKFSVPKLTQNEQASSLELLKRELADKLGSVIYKDQVQDIDEAYSRLMEIDQDNSMTNKVDEAIKVMEKKWEKDYIAAKQAFIKANSAKDAANQAFIKAKAAKEAAEKENKQKKATTDLPNNLADRPNKDIERFLGLAIEKFNQAFRQLPHFDKKAQFKILKLKHSIFKQRMAVYEKLYKLYIRKRGIPAVEPYQDSWLMKAFHNPLFRYYQAQYVRVAAYWLVHFVNNDKLPQIEEALILNIAEEIALLMQMKLLRIINEDLFQKIKKPLMDQNESSSDQNDHYYTVYMVKYESVSKRVQKLLRHVMDKICEYSLLQLYAVYKFLKEDFFQSNITQFELVSQKLHYLIEGEEDKDEIKRYQKCYNTLTSYWTLNLVDKSDNKVVNKRQTNALRRLTLDTQDVGHIRASRKFRKGDIVFYERPLAFKWFRGWNFCEQCHRMVGAIIEPCRRCSRAVFCSRSCRMISETLFERKSDDELFHTSSQSRSTSDAHDCAYAGLMWAGDRVLSKEGFLLFQLYKHCGSNHFYCIGKLINHDGKGLKTWPERLRELKTIFKKKHYMEKSELFWPQFEVALLFGKFNAYSLIGAKIDVDLMVEAYQLEQLLHIAFDKAQSGEITKGPMLYRMLHYVRHHVFARKIFGKRVPGLKPISKGPKRHFSKYVPYGFVLGAFYGAIDTAAFNSNVRPRFNTKRGVIELVATRMIFSGQKIRAPAYNAKKRY